jgi:acyl-CoA synthetase (NDP forming)
MPARRTPPAPDPLWRAVFFPKTVVVVGKTTRPKAGYLYLKALTNQGYRGKVIVVSTDAGDTMGYDAAGSIEALPDGVDYAIVCVPAREVSDTVRRLARRGVRVAHVFSSGFGDLGTEGGRRLETELKDAAREEGIRVIGPNCLGVFSPEVGLSYPPGIFPGEVGTVGFISQSGGTTQSLIWSSRVYSFRLNKAVSVGNSADLCAEDFLEVMIDDPGISIVALYVEGTSDGDRFMELVGRGTRTKPIVILKAGLSEAGASAAASHTGIMAGNSLVWEAAIRQSGAVRVETFEELVQVISAFAKRKARTGPRIALINRGGGEGVVAADVLQRMGLFAPAFSPETRRALSTIMPSAGTGFRNPVDFSAIGGYPGVFEKMFDIVDADDNTDTVIYQHHIEFAHLFREGYNQYLLDALVAFSERAKKTLLVVLPLYFSGEEWLRSFTYLNEKGVSTHPAIDGAAAAARSLAQWDGRP